MELIVREVDGQQVVEGPLGQPLLRRVTDLGILLETCFSHATTRILLYPENLTEHFFDLRSGEAGEILQKLRTYRLRLAIVSPPTLQLSRRFVELLADEQRGAYFRMFADRAAAQVWLGET